MRILLSNDDGIHAKGLITLYKELKEVAQVFVVAPDRERSATGHGITVHHPLRVKEIELSDNIIGWAVDGTPADCVKLGLEALLPSPPDLIISGINYGPNLSTDVLYSGTVSAAIEGIINGIPAAAVSLASYKSNDFGYSAFFTRALIENILHNGYWPGVMLNVNIPPGIPQGVKVTKLGVRRYINCFDKRTDPKGRTYYWMAGEPMDVVTDSPDIDSQAIKENFISITPIHFDLTHFSQINDLKNWAKDIKI
ncbi:5'/3'-nucleotidase SurE [Desulfolucanica intricata]|uniref:5'/3'-nucleotidase SurE n=1 Tax=Desulfolucanica intricata TaxID=1285191 RepID=UPI00082FD03A|nr:5'/3'-nucleotidase SurE [Desulfolucanica intricata]